MRYELVNPSDHVEFDASDDAVALAASILVGSGKLPPRNITENRVLNEGFCAFAPRGEQEEIVDRALATARDRHVEVVAALRSFEIPGPGTHDEKRTSMCDLVAHAASRADALERWKARLDAGAAARERLSARQRAEEGEG